MAKHKYDVFMPKTSEQLESFLQQLLKKRAQNIIVKLIAGYIDADELLSLFFKYEELLKTYKKNKSIVFLIEEFNYDQIPDFISIAPTEEEAIDIIDFEEIERDLFLED